jgi:hypothetical protein
MMLNKVLADTIIRALPRDLIPAPLIKFSDRTDDGQFQRFAGLAAVAEVIANAHRQQDQQGNIYPSVIILGLFPMVTTSSTGKEKELSALLRWPGIEYLQYGFTKEQLIAAAHRAVEGARTPPPADILRRANELVRDDLVRLIQDVQHWLKIRRDTTDGALKNFRKAARGTVRLDPEHLKPIVAISEEHQKMLGRLGEREREIQRFSPQSGRLAVMQAAIEQFKERWDRLEEVRAALRSRGNHRAALRAVIRELESVREPLARAFNMAADLRRELAIDE